MSTTLKAGSHGWNNLHAGVLAEKDPEKQKALRRQALLSDYYLGSVHGLSETGEMLIASNSGSQLPHITFSSPNVIFVVGTQKIVPTLGRYLPTPMGPRGAARGRPHEVDGRPRHGGQQGPGLPYRAYFYTGRKIRILCLVKEKLVVLEVDTDDIIKR